VVKRNRNPVSPKSARKEEVRPVMPTERHSGEGSASALETLQKLERGRIAARPLDPHKDPEN